MQTGFYSQRERRNLHGGAFSLIEVLVVIAVIGLLAAFAVPAVVSAMDRAKVVKCASRMGSLGKAMHAYFLDHDGAFPRSFHSAATFGEPGWAASIAPYLDIPPATTPAQWIPQFNTYYRCPSHDEQSPDFYSYGLNVFFELNPSSDSYTGSPTTWRRLRTVTDPTKTILLAELEPTMFADHVMAHLWTTPAAAANELSERHEGRLNFLFVDGGVRRLMPEDTFSATVNLWNPGLAGD